MKELIKKYQDFLGEDKLNDLDKMTEFCKILSEDLTPKLRERFCRDWGIPIKLYTEPYFSERLAIYNQHTFIVHLLGEFATLVIKAGGEQAYLTSLYNKVKDKAIMYLNDNQQMNYFREKEDMSKYRSQLDYPSGDIYKNTLIDKSFLSIDLVKGNYTALRHYNPEIVGNTATYEEFIAMFTDIPYLQHSKYIRQVIFGNVSPKRQVTYEKYLMGKVLSALLEHGLQDTTVVSLSTDEIILAADNLTKEDLDMVKEILNKCKAEGINTRLECFILRHIPEAKTYYKDFLDGTVDIRCMTHTDMPYVIKALYRNELTENDSVFETEGKLAKWLDPVEINREDLAKPLKSWERF